MSSCPQAVKEMMESATASCMAVCFSNPFEVVKTRLQLQGELQAPGCGQRYYRGVFHGLKVISEQEGIFRLQKGLSASIFHQMCLNGSRLGLYPSIKRKNEVFLGSGFLCSFVSGAMAGGIGGFVGSPAFLVKTRIQSSAAKQIAVGTQHGYNQGVVDALRTIFKHNGLRGLFHGATTGCVRTMVGSAVQLSTYDSLKERVVQTTDWNDRDAKVHFVSSGVAGMLVAFFMNPFDVVMTRRYNMHQSSQVYTSNVFKSLRSIIAIEGVLALYKGCTALWMRIGPHTMLTFLFLEKLRNLRRHYEGL